MSRASRIDPATARRLTGGGHHPDSHNHSHDHAHDFPHPGAGWAAPRVVSLLGRSAIGRLGYLSLLLVALWTSVFWALR